MAVGTVNKTIIENERNEAPNESLEKCNRLWKPK